MRGREEGRERGEGGGSRREGRNIAQYTTMHCDL